MDTEKTKIMIVDDDDINVGILTASLDSSYQICTAKSGQECLDSIDIESPALILLDVQMPEMNGYEYRFRYILAGDY